MHGQPDGEVHSVRSGRAPNPGASVPVELGCITPWYADISISLEALRTPSCCGLFLWRWSGRWEKGAYVEGRGTAPGRGRN